MDAIKLNDDYDDDEFLDDDLLDEADDDFLDDEQDEKPAKKFFRNSAERGTRKTIMMTWSWTMRSL